MEPIHDYSHYHKGEHDFTIEIGPTKFLIHKNFLMEESPYFEVLFSANFIEKSINSVNLKGDNAEDMKVLIDFCYTKKLDRISVEVLRVANKYMFRRVEKIIYNNLGQLLNLDNYIEFEYIPALFYDSKKVKGIIFRFCIQNFKAILDQESFNHLDVSLLGKLLSVEKLYDFNETKALMIVEKWVSYDRSQRWSEFTVLVERIKFDEVSLMILQKWYMDRSVLKLISGARLLGFDYSQHMAMNAPDKSKPTRSAFTNKDYIFIVGLYSPREVAQLLRYDPELDEWDEMKSLNRKITLAEVVIAGQSLYVIEGVNVEENCTLVYRYDISNDTWRTDVANIDSRCGFRQRAIYLDGYIYCFSWATRFAIRLKRYSVSANEWFLCTSVQTSEVCDEILVLNKKIMLLSCSDRPIYLYNPDKDCWTNYSQPKATKKCVNICRNFLREPNCFTVTDNEQRMYLIRSGGSNWQTIDVWTTDLKANQATPKINARRGPGVVFCYGAALFKANHGGGSSIKIDRIDRKLDSIKLN